jgi:hypothetical protein
MFVFVQQRVAQYYRANTRRDDHYASILLYHLNQMSDLGDHAARLRRISELGNAPDLVEPQAD